MIQKPRGTIDILPSESPLWRYIEESARRVSALRGFGEIRFPTFEATELFNRGVGDTTDVVQKEMYTFTDRENRSLTLRPEGTACVARSVVENKLYADAMPLKLYYLTSCFRYEKPQAGRSREFYQFGAEMFGASSPMADAEVIALADAILREIGIDNTSLHINSIGCPECRPKYRAALHDYFEGHKEELCDTCRGRLDTNPLRILDCKSPICSEIAKNAPKTIDYLCPDCAAHLEALKKALDKLGIAYSIDTKIVRGLDYYTRTVFEFIAEDIGAQSTVCGGGRYDGLIEEVGGPATPGIGFAMGITRLILALQNKKDASLKAAAPSLYVAPLGENASVYAMATVEALRNSGIYAECDVVGRSLKAQMKYADKTSAAYTLIIGDGELECGKAKLKNMATSEQTEIDINDIEALKAILTK